MITVISGSNRIGNQTHFAAAHYAQLLKKQYPDTRFYSLEDLPTGFLYPYMYETKNPDFLALENELIIPTQKFVFVVPEYNGSFPGVLKAFIDACEVKKCFHGKKAALVGLGSGRSGNQRGLDQLTAILHHMKMLVLPYRVYISDIDKDLNGDGKLSHPGTLHAVEKQIGEFVAF